VKKFLENAHIPYKTRAYMYRILLAAVPVMLSLSWLTESEVASVVAFAGAVLGLGTATAYTHIPKGGVLDGE
jgi:hypothetical protein